MTFKISVNLEKRLLRKAQLENCTVEELLGRLLEGESNEGVAHHSSAKSQTFPQAEVLRQSQARLQGIIDSQIDLVCRYTMDTVLTFVNDAYCVHFGQKREELLGRSFLPLGDKTQYVDIWNRIEEIKRNPAPAVRLFSRSESDSSVSWIQWVDYGIEDENGEVTEIQAVGRDVTDLIKSQNALRYQQELLQIILDNIPIMLVLFNAEGQVEFVNQYWIERLGWTVEGMRNHPDILSAFYPDPAVRRVVLEYMTLAEPGWRDFEVVARDGTVLETTWANVRLPDGRSIGIGQDIKQRKELEKQQLYAKELEIELQKERELRALKDRFVSIISHEYRTPLTVISVYVSFLATRFNELPEVETLEKLRKIKEQVRRMALLLEDVLKYNKGNVGKTEFYPQKLAADAFFKELIEDVLLMDERRHQIVFEGDAGDLYVDPKLMQHIMHNLLTNALKYSEDGSTVKLTAKETSHDWQITVEDQGIGIPSDELSHLFEPFHRARNAQGYSGTGLGLAIVKEYVNMHGGSITVQSKERQGSKFTVRLPV